MGRALAIDAEAEMIVNVMRGTVTREAAARELGVSDSTIARRIAIFIEAGARELQRRRKAAVSGAADECTDDAVHAVGHQMVELARLAADGVPSGCAEPALHVLGVQRISAQRDARLAG